MSSMHELFDGSVIGQDTPLPPKRVRHEREVMASHMERMRGIRNAADRRVYLEGVERSQGKAWCDALAAEYAAEWAKARAAT